VPDGSLVERIWYGDDGAARLARTALAPASLAYAAISTARNRLYDWGVLRSRSPVVPAVSVGNLTVGGTGKTPIAAWIARALSERGAHPAIILRGYGSDEPLVHMQLNPGVPVSISPNRLAGIARVAEAGVDVAVLDDAFQHRRVKRVADVVLVSADRHPPSPLLLPSGPLREPLAALRRAALVIVTRKAVSEEAAARVMAEIVSNAPGVPVASVALLPETLVRVPEGSRQDLHALRGKAVRLIAGIADPGALASQLTALGAQVHLERFDDHHEFTTSDVERIVGSLAPEEWGVCTLKDSVKLAPLWPRGAPPLWYVSQRLIVEQGAEAIEALLTAVLSARHAQP